MFNALDKNPADIDRIISISFESPVAKLLPGGVNSLKSAASARGTKGLTAFLITAPDFKSQQDPSKAPAVDYAVIAPSEVQAAVDAGATVILLPDVAGQPVKGAPPLSGMEPTYWQISPVAGMNPYLRNLLKNWDVVSGGSNLIDASAKSPRNWFFLFFHEYAAYGGHLGPGGIVRTFFEEALVGTLGLGSVSVSVIQASGGGKPVPNAVVRVHGPVSRATVTDGAGNVTLRNLPPGTYQIEAEGPEFGPNSATTTLAAGAGNAPVTVKLIFNPSTI
jgi:hypothetical protein